MANPKYIGPDLLTFAIFCIFQGQKSNFQHTNGHVGEGLKLNAEVPETTMCSARSVVFGTLK